MSMTRYLLNDARGNLIVFLPTNALEHGRAMVKEDEALSRIDWLPGTRHETLDEALQRTSEAGLSMENNRFIFTIAREPIALMRSYFTHLQKKSTIDLRTKNGELPLRGEQKIAVEGSFEDFIELGTFYGRQPEACTDYYRSNNQPGLNSKVLIIPIERLSDFAAELVKSGICHGSIEVPFRNVSKYDEAIQTDHLRDLVNKRFTSLNSIWENSFNNFEQTVEQLRHLIG